MVLFLFYDCATTPCSGPRSSPLYQSGVRALSKIHDRKSMILLSPSSHASSDCLVYLVREPSCDTPKSQFPMWTQSVWLLRVRLRPRVNATQWNPCPLGNPSLGAPLSVSLHPIIFRVPITALPQCLYLRRPFPQYTDPPPFRTTSFLTTDIPGADHISRRPRSHRAWRTLRNAVPSPRVARTQRTHSSVVRVSRFRHLIRKLPA